MSQAVRCDLFFYTHNSFHLCQYKGISNNILKSSAWDAYWMKQCMEKLLQCNSETINNKLKFLYAPIFL